jgi:hypothetical protein
MKSCAVMAIATTSAAMTHIAIQEGVERQTGRLDEKGQR